VCIALTRPLERTHESAEEEIDDAYRRDRGGRGDREYRRQLFMFQRCGLTPDCMHHISSAVTFVAFSRKRDGARWSCPLAV
jgi:hypothetical protein